MTSVELKDQLDQLDLENVLGVYIIDDNPEDYKFDNFAVNISEKLYLENHEIVDKFVKRLCSYKRQFIRSLYFISNYHMTKEYFNLLKDNETINHLTMHNHELTKEEFEILKQNKELREIDSSSVSKELNDCYDQRIGATMKKGITNFLTVRDIIYDEDLHIFEKLTEEQASEICTLLEKRKVKGTLRFLDLNSGHIIKMIIAKFETIEDTIENEKKVSIEIENRGLFDYEAFNDYEQNSRIEILTKTDEPTDLNMFIKVEEKLRELMKEFKSHESKLSPFEKQLWLYNIVATFRKYKKESNEDEWKESRFLNKLLFTDRMVCVGFSHLLAELSQRSSLNVWENVANSHSENREHNSYNHMNNLTFIEDDKYDIKGAYLLDATFDNHEEGDFFAFNHFLVTPTNYAKHIMNMYAAGYSLLTLKDKAEFIETLKNDRMSLYSLIQIIHPYYKNHEFFKVESDSGEGYYLHCLRNIEQLYELAQGINIEPIPEEKFKRALVHIETLKNPFITVDELTTKLNETFRIYNERNKSIYQWQETEEKKKALH